MPNPLDEKLARFEELERYPFVSNAGWLDDEMRKACDAAHAQGNYAGVFDMPATVCLSAHRR